MQLLTSEEVQMKASKMGRVTVLNDPAINKAFASDLEWTKGKNLQGIFKSKPARLVSNNDRYSRWVLDELDNAYHNPEFRKYDSLKT